MIGIVIGDCLDALPAMPTGSVDAIVTDPPYGLGFMGKQWDDLPPGVPWATECLRVLKPGGHLLAFGGTRTYHRLACAVEDAGFEIRDQLAWLYGSGFPKSLNVGKAIDKAAGAERERGPRVGGALNAGTANGWAGSSPDSSTAPLAGTQQVGPPITPEAERWDGWGTALKPAHEPIVLARKPLIGTVSANVLAHGAGALNVDGCRIEFAGEADRESAKPGGAATAKIGALAGGSQHDGERSEFAAVQGAGRWPANVLLDERWEPIVCLAHDTNEDVYTILSGWCDARACDVPAVRGRVRRAAEPGEAPPVLLAAMPASVDVGEPTGRASSEVRPQALARVDHEDARNPIGRGKDGTCESELEGFLPGQGLRHGEPARPSGDPGAPPCDGEGAGPATTSVGSRASHQRGQDGQPAGESGDSRHTDARDDACGHLPGAARTARPRREVLLRDVPEHWLRFFEFTGDVANVGAAAMLDEQTGEMAAGNHPSVRKGIGYTAAEGRANAGTNGERRATEVGGASRFFYVAKASSRERNAGLEGFEERDSREGLKNSTPRSYQINDAMGKPPILRKNTHPTVKPIALMRWLVRLVTPPGGLVIDPFAGSGTTGIACSLEGLNFIGIEREADYVEIARARIAHWGLPS